MQLPAALSPIALLSACSSWWGAEKEPIPGKRIAVMTAREGLTVDDRSGHVTLPPAAANADWPQAGGNPAHAMGHLQARDTLETAWRSDIGEGGDYRRKITAQPVIAAGRVFTMDSDGQVTAYDVTNGGRIWRLDTQAEDNRSSNLGGGISVDGDILYAGTGRAEILAVSAATGDIKWRKSVSAPVRSAPTIADGRVYFATLDSRLQALATDDGRRLWGFQAATPETGVLGLPAPAFAEGLVVGGFGSGELVALRAATGSVAWTDSLAAARGRNSLVDLSAIRGLPVVTEGTVYVGSLGGLVLSLDIRSGRRLWERDIASGDTPWVAGDWLFIHGTDGKLAAIARADGRVAWLTQLPQYQDEEKKKDPIRWVGPVLAGERLILGSSSAEAIAVNPVTGEILGRQPLPGPVSVSPAIAGGTVFVVTDDGTLAALR